MSDIYNGDCREVRSVIADNSIDTIITDPPYGLEFMGEGWDKGVPGVEFWAEFLKVAKPGATLLAFGGTRTYHRMVCAIEDAGWEIRDCMMWLYGSGFPKSHDISKALDKNAGHWRGKAGEVSSDNGAMSGPNYERSPKGDPITATATAWNGWGTALKPAWEPIIVAMKPLDGTFAKNAEKWGVAGINVDGGRIKFEGRVGREKSVNTIQRTSGIDFKGNMTETHATPLYNFDKGRWPANLILDEEAAAMLDEQSGELKSASRFFYCAKASKSERNRGCEGLPDVDFSGGGTAHPKADAYGARKSGTNCHPTVKPLKLMEYLCTLTKTPTGGIVLDPFAGSGTTLLAAKNTGREYIGIEQNPEYIEIIKARLGVL